MKQLELPPKNTRIKLIEAYLREFAHTPDPSEIRISEVLKNSGISKGSFYHYFDSKGHLHQESINYKKESSQEFIKIHETEKEFKEIVKEDLRRLISLHSGIAGTKNALISKLLSNNNQDFKKAFWEDYKFKLQVNEQKFIELQNRTLMSSKFSAKYLAELFLNGVWGKLFCDLAGRELSEQKFYQYMDEFIDRFFLEFS